jgi:hypothetical protein
MLPRTAVRLALAGGLVLGAFTLAQAQQPSAPGRAACPHAAAMGHDTTMMAAMGTGGTMPMEGMGHGVMPRGMASRSGDNSMTPAVPCPHAD